MQLRTLILKHIPELLDLYDQFERPKSPHPHPATQREILKAIEDTGGCVVGAFVGGKLIGSLTVNLCANLSWSGRPYAMIENVIVDSTNRRQQVGSRLLQFAVEFAKSKNCYKVMLLTGSQEKSVLNFYKVNGFVGNKTGFQIRFGV